MAQAELAVTLFWHAAWLRWLLLPLLLYAALCFAVVRRDQAELYSTAVPRWAAVVSYGEAEDAMARHMQGRLGEAAGFPLWRQLLYTARTRHSLLRLFHVVPDRTAYTRLQLTHVRRHAPPP